MANQTEGWQPKVQDLAVSFVEHSNSSGLKGRERNAAAWYYFDGASAMATILGEPQLATALKTHNEMIVGPRGFVGVLIIAEGV